MEFERRFYPRISFSTDIRLILPNASEEYLGKCINMSFTGFQIEIDKDTSDFILKNCSHPAQFRLTWEFNEIQYTNIPVRVNVNRRVSSNRYHMGLKFHNLSLEEKQLIKNLLANLL